MVYPIQPSDPTYLHPQQENPQQKQRQFEVQFITAVLGIYNSITGRSHSIDKQLSQVKQGLDSGKSPDQLAQDLNLAITQINQGSGASLPMFQLTSEGNQIDALTGQIHILEKCLYSLAENGKIDKKHEQKLSTSLEQLSKEARHLTLPDAYNRLNGIILLANQQLPKSYHLPTLS